MTFLLKDYCQCIQNKRVCEKLSFFSNYFNYVVMSFKKNDTVIFDTHLTLVEKIIFQIENNIVRSKKYVTAYFGNPLFSPNDTLFNNQKYSSEILSIIQKYFSLKNNDKKAEYLLSTLSLWKKYKTYLKRTLFSRLTSRVGKYIFCENEVNFKEFLRAVEMLAASLYYKGYSQKELLRLTDDIFSRENFPFPSQMKEEEKEKYLKKLNTVFSRLKGLKNFYHKQGKKRYFIFRISNIRPEKDFEYSLNRNLGFYGADHEKFKFIKAKLSDHPFFNDFFNDAYLFAIVKVNFLTQEMASKEAREEIKKHIPFLNKALHANSFLNPYYYIHSDDFKNFNISYYGREGIIHLNKNHYKNLDYWNAYKILKASKSPAKQKILANEHLFFKALQTQNPQDYWQYVENIFYPHNNQVKEIFSFILLSSVESHMNDQILNDVTNILLFSHNTLGISAAKIHDMDRKNSLIELQKEINHPFLRFLLSSKKLNYHEIFNYYRSIVLSCESQRNAMIHSNKQNPIEQRQLFLKFQNLFIRIREELINAVLRDPSLSFEEIMERHKVQAQKLLSKH